MSTRQTCPPDARRLGVAAVGAGAGVRRAARPPGPARPSGAMSTARARSPWRSTRKTVRTPSQSRWNPLIAVSRALNRGAPSGLTQPGSGRVVGGAEQQGAGRDPAVLVGRQRRDPQRLQRGGDPERVGRVEVVGDDQVLDRVRGTARSAVRRPRGRTGRGTGGRAAGGSISISRRSAGRNGVGLPGWKQVAGPEPLDLDAQAVRVVVEPVVRPVGEPVPVDEAPVAAGLEHGVGEEVLEVRRSNVW